jgi:hypothetical protein
MKNPKIASLRALRHKNRKDTKCINKDIIKIIADTKVLILRYESIKSKPGNCTPRLDKDGVLDGISKFDFDQISKDILSGLMFVLILVVL